MTQFLDVINVGPIRIPMERTIAIAANRKEQNKCMILPWQHKASSICPDNCILRERLAAANVATSWGPAAGKVLIKTWFLLSSTCKIGLLLRANALQAQQSPQIPGLSRQQPCNMTDALVLPEHRYRRKIFRCTCRMRRSSAAHHGRSHFPLVACPQATPGSVRGTCECVH